MWEKTANFSNKPHCLKPKRGFWWPTRRPIPDGFDWFCTFHGSSCQNYTPVETGRAIYMATFSIPGATVGTFRRCRALRWSTRRTGVGKKKWCFFKWRVAYRYFEIGLKTLGLRLLPTVRVMQSCVDKLREVTKMLPNAPKLQQCAHQRCKISFPLVRVYLDKHPPVFYFVHPVSKYSTWGLVFFT